MSTPNFQHSDKWSVLFSNLPGYDIASNINGMTIYDLYVKELTLPSLSLELTESKFRNYEVRHQISKVNDTIDDISMTFKVSEGLENYFHVYDWIQSMREMLNVDNKQFFRQNYINEIKVFFLDNEKRPKFKYTFIDCFATNVSSLTLTNGVDDELTFTVTIKFEDYRIEVVTEC